MEFDWSPDAQKLISVFALMPSQSDMRGRITRKFRDFTRKEGPVSLESLMKELPALEQIDLDLFYRPGNTDIRYWAALDLDVLHRSARISVFGEYDSFSRIFDRFVSELGLVKTQRQLLNDRLGLWRETIDRKLFEHISGALGAGNFGSAFSSAVVYVEDRLRAKIGTHGTGLTGVELVQAAFKNPGLLSPPLSYANNPEDNAHLMVRGWMGLVRNLHGHIASVAISLEEADAQLSGMNYMLWVIENSKLKP
ncbi:hypothetical protein DB347_22735 [Opitutaceae bacterium EW11]|nr:hypothetical protein DB347_22735 [Opitutaceae bacterium EW11]